VEPLVLIVDDNEQNLKLARDVLRAAGFRTLEAETGTEGLSLAAEHVPDVVLMDLRLPDMDGTDAARALAGEPLTAHIPVVALSALRLDERPSEPFAGSIEKPITIDTFPAEVRRYMGC
jgi:two-component system cell cycle response regulator DivK